MDYEQRDLELINHFSKYQGNPTNIINYDTPQPAPSPIYILEFSPVSEEDEWIYITVGASRLQAPQGNLKHRFELMMYSHRQESSLTDVLAGLATYPFINHTSFGVGDTIAGTPGVGVVHGSPIIDFILTYVYFEEEGFDEILHTDGTHTYVLWATPIYHSEREYAKQHGWKELVELFSKNEIQPSDLWRSPIV